MSTVIMHHINASELPTQWREQLNLSPGQHVTVIIETEAEEQPAPTPTSEPFTTDDPAFGIWRDRDDISDVETYARELRAPRYKLY